MLTTPHHTPFDPTAWPAPAKLNRMLHITGRRADGYHTLQTVFQFLDHGDDLWFTPRSDGVIHHQNPLPTVPEAQDLTVRAACLLQKATGTRCGTDIRIHKRLPLGGGLGGGSSNAATALVALNHLWETGLSVDALATLGLQLGADVPVFVRGHAAWAEGVGEQLTPIDLDCPWFVVIIPPVWVSTGAIFGDSELTRDTPPITIAAFLAGAGRNDCATVVYQRYPQVAAAATWLSQYGEARLTGTGACVFAALPDETTAALVVGHMPTGWQALAARGLNVSPLFAKSRKPQ